MSETETSLKGCERLGDFAHGMSLRHVGGQVLDMVQRLSQGAAASEHT